MMRGERKARGASRRMCRSPCPSRSAISAKEPMRPSLMSSIHPRALAIAMSKASRLSGLEVYLKIDGRMVYLWRAVDAEGEVLDVLIQSRRNKRTALKLMRKLLKKYGSV